MTVNNYSIFPFLSAVFILLLSIFVYIKQRRSYVQRTFIIFSLLTFIWLFFYATEYNVYQNIAIFIVSILAFGGIMGAAWAPWGIKHGHKFEKKSGIRKEISNNIKKGIDEELEKKSKK